MRRNSNFMWESFRILNFPASSSQSSAHLLTRNALYPIKMPHLSINQHFKAIICLSLNSSLMFFALITQKTARTIYQIAENINASTLIQSRRKFHQTVYFPLNIRLAIDRNFFWPKCLRSRVEKLMFSAEARLCLPSNGFPFIGDEMKKKKFHQQSGSSLLCS